MDIDSVLSKKNITYKEVESFLENDNQDNYYKILFGISKFSENDAKMICKYIISNSNNSSIIDKACMEIITCIKYDNSYYKEIITIIEAKNCRGIWVTELKRKLLDDMDKTVEDVFNDFSKPIPQNILYDISIIEEILNQYDDKYINALTIDKKRAIEICKRMNCITTMYVYNILKVFSSISDKYGLVKEEIESFLEDFSKNYPHICKRFVDSIQGKDGENLFYKELRKKVMKQNEEDMIKYNMEIFKPNTRRIMEYRKFQFKQNNLINKMSEKNSILRNIAKSNTILYGRRYGVTVINGNKTDLSIGNMHEFRYEYPLPIEYLVDPIAYMAKLNSLKKLGRGKK